MHNSYESDSEDELSGGWEAKTTQDGNVYYVNSHVNKIQWTHPATGKKKVIPKDLPFGWTKIIDDDGKNLFVHKDTGTKTTIDPRLAFAKEEKKHANDFRQKFDASSTAYQILHGVDLSGKYALITGSNAGIGYETAKSLARHNCNIIFANRNFECTEQAIKDIVAETNACKESLSAVHLDLASLKSVKNCALEVKQKYNKIDMLILNAGVFGIPYSETEDKIETICQVNHISHMYLALLLEPLLKRGSRVVFVSSESHRFASLKNLFLNQNLSMTADNFFSMMAYNNSKLFNVITAKMLSQAWASKGICVNSLHPGNMVYTNLSKSWWLYRFLFLLVRPFTKSLQQAAATTIYVATADDLDGVTGLYFNNCFYCEESALAKDNDIMKSVFEISLQMIVDRIGSDHIEEYVEKYLKNPESSNS